MYHFEIHYVQHVAIIQKKINLGHLTLTLTGFLLSSLGKVQPRRSWQLRDARGVLAAAGRIPRGF